MNDTKLDWSLTLYQGQSLIEKIGNVIGPLGTHTRDSVLRYTKDGLIAPSPWGLPLPGYEQNLPEKIALPAHAPLASRKIPEGSNVVFSAPCKIHGYCTILSQVRIIIILKNAVILINV